MTKKMRLGLGLLKIGEVAEEAKVMPSTIRYYTEIGLLKVKELTEGGYRLSEKEDVLDRLRMVKEVREGSKGLTEIRAMIN